MDSRKLNGLAGLIFIGLGIYTYVVDPDQWALAVMWAAVGLVFIGVGIRRGRSE